ncbi:hypothetical protein J6590_037000 [Homalodisca vitripennis]|nr:hypothetical protein J6590_037000 [Homalodisca vitripennis]
MVSSQLVAELEQPLRLQTAFGVALGLFVVLLAQSLYLCSCIVVYLKTVLKVMLRITEEITVLLKTNVTVIGLREISGYKRQERFIDTPQHGFKSCNYILQIKELHERGREASTTSERKSTHGVTF